jgi:hypothetical protein
LDAERVDLLPGDGLSSGVGISLFSVEFRGLSGTDDGFLEVVDVGGGGGRLSSRTAIGLVGGEIAFRFLSLLANAGVGTAAAAVDVSFPPSPLAFNFFRKFSTSSGGAELV